MSGLLHLAVVPDSYRLVATNDLVTAFAAGLF